MIRKDEPLQEVPRIGEPIERWSVSFPRQPLYSVGERYPIQYTAGRPEPMLNGITAEEMTTIRELMEQFDLGTPAQRKMLQYKQSKPIVEVPIKQITPEMALKLTAKGQAEARARKAEIPNKVAASDPRWGTKVAWSSDALMERQSSLETYSVEVELMFESVRTIVFRILGKKVANDAMRFVANFGSPIADNVQKISVLLEEPVDLKIQLVRALVGGRLQWTGEVEATVDTPLTTKTGRSIDVSKGDGDLPVMPNTKGTVSESGPQGPQYKELPSVAERRRKVKL